MFNRSWWIIAICLVTAGMAQAAMYKWVDEDGVTQYTQFPPPDRQADTIAPPPPPAEDPVEARRKLDESLQKQSEEDTAATTAEEEQTKALSKEEQREKNCQIARDNLEKLTTGGRKRFIGPDGVATYLPEEDLQQRITEAQQQIEQYCN